MGRVQPLLVAVAPALAELQAADTSLKPRAAARSAHAFGDELLRHEPAVRRLVHRLLGWPLGSADVDDVVQEVFLQAWRHRRRFRGESACSTWLVRIGLNTTRNHQRKRALWRRLFAAHDAHEPVAPPPGIDLDAKFAPVRCAMKQLSHRDRELLVLRYLEQRSIEQIAHDLRLSRNAVDVRLSRARERLRGLLPEGLDA